MSTEIRKTGCTDNCNIIGAGGILVCSTCDWDEYMSIASSEVKKDLGFFDLKFLVWTHDNYFSKFEWRTEGLFLMDKWYNTPNYAAMQLPISTKELYELYLAQTK